MLLTRMIVLFLAAPLLPVAQADDEVKIGIVERLGDTLPREITLTDERGNPVPLKDLLDKPTALALVYYECPGICGPLMDGIRTLVDKADAIGLLPGHDFNIITVSFDHRETHVLAATKKRNYIEALKTKIPENGWRFLTGNQENIRKLTDAIGFRYIQEGGKTFNHTAALTILSPEGKIIRYLHGTTFLPFDLKMSIIEAAEGTVGSSVTRGFGPKILLYCFGYDPEGRRYAFNILKVIGTASILFVLSFAGFLFYRSRKARRFRTGSRPAGPKVSAPNV